jgi:hypothetical protein
VPAELLAKLLLGSDVRTILASRRASSHVSRVASTLITELQAQGGALPPEAWQRFPAATKLRTTRGEGDQPQHGAALLQLLGTLPGRLEALRISAATPPRLRAGPKQLAQALAAAPFAGRLQLLHVGDVVTTADADELLRRLPSLQELSLVVMPPPGAAPTTWRPAAAGAPCAQRLTQLALTCRVDVSLDVSVLRCCSGLQKLRIEQMDNEGYMDGPGLDVEHLRAISSLTRLEHLHCTDHGLLSEFAALQELRVLELPYATIDGVRWSVLARLPRLSELLLEAVYVDGSAAPLACLTRLAFHRAYCSHDDICGPPLCELAPNLNELHLNHDGDSLAPLEGHTALKSLVLYVDIDEEEFSLMQKDRYDDCWEQTRREKLLLHDSVWQSLPALEHLTIDGIQTTALIVAELLNWLPALKTLDVVVELAWTGMDTGEVRQLLPPVLHWHGAAVKFSIAECQIVEWDGAARCKLVIG